MGRIRQFFQKLHERRLKRVAANAREILMNYQPTLQQMIMETPTPAAEAYSTAAVRAARKAIIEEVRTYLQQAVADKRKEIHNMEPSFLKAANEMYGSHSEAYIEGCDAGILSLEKSINKLFDNLI